MAWPEDLDLTLAIRIARGEPEVEARRTLVRSACEAAASFFADAQIDALLRRRFDEGRWLRADVAIECGTPEHAAAIRLAVLAICLYPIGLFVFNAALLVAARRAIRGEAPPSVLSVATRFLHRE